MMLLTLAAAAIVILVGNYLFQTAKYRRLARSNGCEPPRKYPHKDPVFGLDGFIQSGEMFTKHTFFPVSLQRFKTIGSTFEAISLGKRTIHSKDPENIQSVFSTNAQNWGVSYRLPPLGPYFGKGFITTDGAEWQHSRQQFNHSFHKSNINDHRTYGHYLDLLISKIPKDGSTVDLQELTFNLYLDTSTLFLFGESFESLSKGFTEDTKVFTHSFAKSFEGGGIRMALGPLMFLYRDKTWQEANEQNHEFVQKYVDKAIARRDASKKTEVDSKQRKTFLDSMAQVVQDPVELRNEVTHAFAAAHETTACLISNVMWLLARRTDVWERLRKEVELLGESELDFEAPMKIKYLQNVLNEAIRLYPVFPYHIRQAAKDCVLPTGGGKDSKSPIYVRAGDRFEANFLALQRDPAVWGDDADQFKPDRWETAQPLPWQYVPFGGGPRACVGKQKALMETSFYICRILQEFKKIEPRDDREWTGQVQITAKNLHGVKVALTPA